MKRKIIAFLMCVLILFSCTGCTEEIYENLYEYLYTQYIDYNAVNIENYDEQYDVNQEFADPGKSIYRNFGSAKKLVGDCALVTIFMADEESIFTINQEEEAMSKLTEAVNYLTNKANLFGRELEIVYNEPDLIYRFNSKNIISTNFDDTNWSVDLLERINSDKIVQEIYRNYGIDNVGFVINVNKEGQSYAVSTNKYVMKKYDNEKCVIYSQYSGSETNAYVYAHEILHLFGATDLYYPNDIIEYRKDLAEEYFPNEIMLDYHYNLKNAMISDVTAYLIGWKDKLKKEYEDFVEDYIFEPEHMY